MNKDISELINNILKNTESATFEVDNSNNTSDFKAEPILRKASEISPPISPKYKQMFAIMPKENTNFWEPIYQKEQFYLQAKFMEDFEDNYPVIVHSYKYIPKYNDYSIQELRAYFTWRSKVRNKNVTMNSVSFVYLYIYELINGIGATDVMDGLSKILYIWNEYRKFDVKIDTYLSWWTKDYYILNLSENLNYKEFFDMLPIKPSDNEFMLSELANGNFTNNISFFNKYSSYKIMNSRFYSEKNIPIINNCFCYVFKAIMEFCKNKKIDFTNLFIGKTTGLYQIGFYRNAIHYCTTEYADTTLNLTNNEKYVCKDGIWKAQHISIQTFLSKNIIGYVLKSMEIRIREHLKYKYKLTNNSSGMVNECLNRNFVDNYSPTNFFKLLAGEEFLKTINSAVDECFIENKYTSAILPKEPPKPPKIVFDTNKFSEIRKTSETIKQKLIVEEEIEILAPIKIKKLTIPTLSGIDEFVKTLDNTEIMAIKYILQDNASKIQDISTIMIEVLIENINEKALNFLNDNIIDSTANPIVIYDDYADDLRGFEIFL